MQNYAQQRLQQGVEQFFQPKAEGDIDLVAEVRKLLNESGLQVEVANAYDTNRFVVEAVGKSSDVQRHLLNRFFAQQLVSAPTQSIEERYCLIPDGKIEDWLNLFRAKVLPFLIVNRLPAVL